LLYNKKPQVLLTWLQEEVERLQNKRGSKGQGLQSQRFDCSGMRWIVATADSLLQLRCLEVNADWEVFFAWILRENERRLLRHEKVRIRAQPPKSSVLAA
jgi:hypothetical protein